MSSTAISLSVHHRSDRCTSALCFCGAVSAEEKRREKLSKKRKMVTGLEVERKKRIEENAKRREEELKEQHVAFDQSKGIVMDVLAGSWASEDAIFRVFSSLNDEVEGPSGPGLYDLSKEDLCVLAVYRAEKDALARESIASDCKTDA